MPQFEVKVCNMYDRVLANLPRTNNSVEGWHHAFDNTMRCHHPDVYALIEEMIIGTELTVGVIGNHNPLALPASQAIAAHGILSIEEKFLPGAGENQTPAPISRDATNLVKKTMVMKYV